MPRPRGISTGKERLIEAAGRTFRAGGYCGTGIDAVAKEAGLTSGAFYAHFGSKANAFRMAIVDGLDLLLGAVKAIQASTGDGWLPTFIDFYLAEQFAVDMSHACALPTLTADVARLDTDIRRDYTAKLNEIAEALAVRLDGNANERAWALLASLAGTASIARAVDDDAVRASILDAGRRLAKSI